MWRRGTQAAARNRNPRADSGSRSPHLLSSIMRSAGDSERATSASDMGRTRTTTLMLSADCEEAAGPCCEPEDAEKVEKAPEEVGARGRGGRGEGLVRPDVGEGRCVQAGQRRTWRNRTQGLVCLDVRRYRGRGAFPGGPK